MYANMFVYIRFASVLFFRVVRAAMDGFLSNVCPCIDLYMYINVYKYMCIYPHCVPLSFLFLFRVVRAGMDGFLSNVCPCIFIKGYMFIYKHICLYM